MPEPAVADLWNDLHPLLDQELSRLPDKYRVLIVLCDLAGKSRKEVARQVGCPEGTVAGRLARGRAMLAKRLARHGLAVSGGSLATALAQNVASASVPASVVYSSIKAASLAAAGKTAAISMSVASLAEGALKTMLLSKLKNAMLALVALVVMGVAAGASTRLVLAQHRVDEKQGEEAAKRDGAAQQKSRQEAKTLTLSGSTALDGTRIARINVVADCDIDKMCVNVGDRVKKGEPLAEVRGPAIDRMNRERLRLAGLNNKQIEAAIRAGGMTVLSPMEGVVVERQGVLGERVTKGRNIYQIADPSALVGVASIRKADLPFLKKGMPVTIEAPGTPSVKFAGELVAVPSLDPAKSEGVVRFSIKNPSPQLRAGQFVTLTVEKRPTPHRIEAGEQQKRLLEKLDEMEKNLNELRKELQRRQQQ